METTVIERIITIKKNEKLTNEKLSLRSLVPIETIKSMFSKKTNPSLDTITKIYSAFPHYSLEWIICGTGDMYKQNDGSKLIEIVAGKNLSVVELRREYVRLLKVEQAFNEMNAPDVAAAPETVYGNPYEIIEHLKNTNIKYQNDIEWLKKELDSKQDMINILLSGNVSIQKNVG